MPGAEQRSGQVRPIGQPNFQQHEPGGMQTPGAGHGEGRAAFQGREDIPLSAAARDELKIHYGGTPIVTVRLVNGVPQDIPHLFTDGRGELIRWWVERESITSWQERVRAAKASGDERYKDVDPDRIPSSITHHFPHIPEFVLEKQPEFAEREWVTYAYSFTPIEDEKGKYTFNPSAAVEEHTFLNTQRTPEDETTSFRRSLRVVEVSTLMSPEENSDHVFIWREIPEEIAPTNQGEPSTQPIKPQPKADDEE